MPVDFGKPHLLFLLLLLLPWWLLVWPRAHQGVLFARGVGGRRPLRHRGVGGSVVLILPRLLRLAGMGCLVISLAEPQRVESTRDVSFQGKAIALAVDISSSMLATDMEGGASRLQVAREAAVHFAQARTHDELSLVAFAGQAMTRVPPTTDPRLIVSAVESLEVEMVGDGTDISAAVLTSTARLLSSAKEPRVVILLTDGAHNGEGVEPPTAARAAAVAGVKIHAISIVSPDGPTGASAAARWRAASQERLAQERETALSAISALTGGQYFRASSGAALDSIYREIDRIERPVEQITDKEVRHPLRTLLLLTGLGLLGVEVILRGSRWGAVP